MYDDHVVHRSVLTPHRLAQNGFWLLVWNRTPILVFEIGFWCHFHLILSIKIQVLTITHQVGSVYLAHLWETHLYKVSSCFEPPCLYLNHPIKCIKGASSCVPTDVYIYGTASFLSVYQSIHGYSPANSSRADISVPVVKKHKIKYTIDSAQHLGQIGKCVMVENLRSVVARSYFSSFCLHSFHFKREGGFFLTTYHCNTS